MKRLTALILTLAMTLSIAVSPALAVEMETEDTGVTIVTEEDAAADEDSDEIPEAETDTETDTDETAADEAEPSESTDTAGESAEDTSVSAEADADEEETTDAEETVSAEETVTEDDLLTEDADDSVAVKTEDEEIVTASYTLNKTKRLITVSAKSGSNIRTNLNNAMSKAKSLATASKPYTVKVPKGSYTISAVVYLYSNITLDLTGVTLTYTGKSGNMMVTGTKAQRKSAKGYSGFVNITVKNGTLKGSTSRSSGCLMRLGHGKNITISGTTFSRCYGDHEIEAAGINGLTVENCTFKNVYPPSGVKDGYEALELDILANDRCFGDFVQDGTTLKNVTITGCSFSNVPRGIGCHNQLVGAYHTGITISNNTFNNIKDAAIFCTAFRNCVIENNTITNATRGIYFVSMRKNAASTYVKAGSKKYSGSIQRDMNTVIRNNTISVKQMSSSSSWGHYGVMGIQLYGVSTSSSMKNNDSKYKQTIPAGNYTMTGVTISGNTVKSSGYGIYCQGVRSSTIKSNTVSYTGKSGKSYSGIYTLSQCTGNKITGNTVKSFPKYNIYLSSKATASSVSNNKLSKSGSAAIYVSAAAVTTIQGNTISSSSGKGIYLNSIRAKCSLSDNTVSGCSSYPIQLSSSTSYTVTLTNNTLKAKSSTYGLYVSKGRISVNQNTLTNGKYAVCTASGVKGSIFYNTLTDCTSNRYYIKGKKSYKAKNMTAPTLSGVTVGSTSVKVQWAKVSDASGYVIQYATKSDFSNAKKVTVTSGSTLSKTLSGLTAGKTYYVRVRSYHTYNGIKVYSSYSSKGSAAVEV